MKQNRSLRETLIKTFPELPPDLAGALYRIITKEKAIISVANMGLENRVGVVGGLALPGTGRGTARRVVEGASSSSE